MKSLLLAIVALALVACGSTKAVLNTSLGAACGTYANNLNNLAPAKHSLDAKTIAAIDMANSLTDPVCLPGAIPADYAAAVTLVTSESAAIYAIYQANKKGS